MQGFYFCHVRKTFHSFNLFTNKLHFIPSDLTTQNQTQEKKQIEMPCLIPLVLHHIKT